MTLDASLVAVELGGKVAPEVRIVGVSLVAQLRLAVARVLGQLGKLLGVATEHVPLLVRINAVFGALRMLTHSAIALRNKLLAELADLSNSIINTLPSLDAVQLRSIHAASV